MPKQSVGIKERYLNESGSALIGAVVLSVVMAIGSLGYLQMVTSSANNEIQGLNESKAFHAAESGLLLGTRWLEKKITWPAQDTVIFPALSINGATVEVKDSVCANGQIYIISKATTSNLPYTKRISWKLDSVAGTPFDTTAFDHAMMSDGTISGGGNATIANNAGVRGSIHSNQAIDLKLGNNDVVNANISSTVSVAVDKGEVKGTVRSPVITGSSNFSGGKVLTAVAAEVFPDIDLIPWYDIALANNRVYNNMADVPATINSPPGGVIWIKGGGDIGVNTTITNASVIIEGVTGQESKVHGTLSAPTGGFALASVYGDVKVNAGANIDGLVYVKNGNYHQNGHSTMTGQVLVKGTIKSNGTGDFTFKKSIPIVPPGGNGSGISIVAGTWQEKNL